MAEIQLSEPHNIRQKQYGDSFEAWSNFYLQYMVGESSPATFEAKKRDLKIFAQFALDKNMAGHVQRWTPSLTKAFQEEMLQRYSAATVKRMMATLSHFVRWLKAYVSFIVADPMQGVLPIRLEEPAWNGLSKKELLQLRAAVDIRLSACRRKDQNPKLEAAVFYILLFTGLRESELVNLNFGQYRPPTGLINVRRKGKRITKRVAVPKEAKKFLDEYLAEQQSAPNDPLFKSRGGKRLGRKDVFRMCQRISKFTHDRVNLTPHMLRHTFLKRVTDKHGVHVAQKLSGNTSVREIFRYARPSDEEMEQVVEGLF